jgi:hypothetical protein
MTTVMGMDLETILIQIKGLTTIMGLTPMMEHLQTHPPTVMDMMNLTQGMTSPVLQRLMVVLNSVVKILGSGVLETQTIMIIPAVPLTVLPATLLGTREQLPPHNLRLIPETSSTLTI